MKKAKKNFRLSFFSIKLLSGVSSGRKKTVFSFHLSGKTSAVLVGYCIKTELNEILYIEMNSWQKI